MPRPTKSGRGILFSNQYQVNQNLLLMYYSSPEKHNSIISQTDRQINSYICAFLIIAYEAYHSSLLIGSFTRATLTDHQLQLTA